MTELDEAIREYHDELLDLDEARLGADGPASREVFDRIHRGLATSAERVSKLAWEEGDHHLALRMREHSLRHAESARR